MSEANTMDMKATKKKLGMKERYRVLVRGRVTGPMPQPYSITDAPHRRAMRMEVR